MKKLDKVVWDVIWKEPGRQEESERYDEYGEARMDYINMANGNRGALEYVIFRSVKTSRRGNKEEIYVIDRTDTVPGEGE